MNRKARRADPSSWYKLDAFFDDQEVAHGLDDAHAQYVRGRLDEIVIVSIPDGMSFADRATFMQGFREVASLASEELKYVLVPSSVRFLRLSPVGHAQTKDLERALRLRQIRTRVRAAKIEATKVTQES